MQSIPEAVKAMKGGSVESWMNTADTAHSIGRDQQTLSSDVAKAVEELRQAWSGHGADAAITRLAIFGNSMGATGDTLILNAGNVQDVAMYYIQISNYLVDVDPPQGGLATAERPWTTDIETEIAHYNETMRRNTEIYNGYVGHVQQQGGGLHTEYGGLRPFDAGAITITPGSGGSLGRHGSPAGGNTPTRRPSAVQNPSVSMPAGQSPASASVGPGSPGANAASGPDLPGTGASDEGTDAAAFRPPSVGGLSGSGGLSGTSVPGLPSGSGTSTGVDGLVSGPLVGGGLPGSGSGSGSSGRLPGGPGTGARTGVGSPAGDLHSQASGNRAGNRFSSMTPGGMVPGGRGKTEEDNEHKRRYGLDEVVLFPEEDEGAVPEDPVTGMKIAPPTIGS